MVITEILERNAALYGDDTALVEINPLLEEEPSYLSWREYQLVEPNIARRLYRSMTWRAFEEQANQTANMLLTKGLKRGEKVAILLMNCLEWLPIYFGILKAGGIVVPLNFRYTAEEIKYCLELAEVHALIFGREFVSRIETFNNGSPHFKNLIFMADIDDECPPFAECYYDLLPAASPTPPSLSLKEEDDAAIYFSSGTTGFPKAILHDHRSLLSSCETEQNHHGQTKDDVFLCIPPLYHTGAKMHWFGSFLVGGKAVLLRAVKPHWILKAISEERCTIVWLLVPWAQDILDAIDSGEVCLDDYPHLAQWRLMHIGAQPVPPSLIHRWRQVFPHHQYDTNYGLSESIGPGCVHLGVENVDKVGAIGKAGYHWQVAIVDEMGQPVSGNQVGELIVKGPGVMKCYFRDPEATAVTLRDGWLYTGDMAQYDADGFIYLVDRKKDVIISGGENIYPVQIEDFLRAHEDIKDVAVIGLPEKRLGEIAVAVIQLKVGSDCREEDIYDYCQQLPRYKRPRRLIFADVPRNPTGKIEKPVLRQRYGGDQVVAKQIHS